VLTNYDEIAQLLRVMGFEVREAGPFKGVPVREQFLAFANASLSVFVFGAELGPAWVGMPDGSCTAVLHPANIMDTLSYWVADKVGASNRVKVAARVGFSRSRSITVMQGYAETSVANGWVCSKLR
jgi:hypothetical protein